MSRSLPDPTAQPRVRLATASRRERMAALGGSRFDLLIVGGGITGAGVARDAALRGLRVALVEQDDFASGTSSRSSRLVHGGVRYLEHGHLHLVFESSAERRRLLHLAPHLVRPLAFTWPVYRGARVPRWKLGAGLLVYDLLSLFRNVRPHEQLSRDEVLAHEPRLRADGLLGGARYFDAATDDARLTLANAVGASEAGAVVINHVRVESLARDGGGRVTGARVVDRVHGDSVDVAAAVVVNATGPWADDVRRMAGLSTAGVRGSKGVHIAVARARVGNRDALTLTTPQDGRVFFVLPAGEQTIIGTTDTYTGEPASEVRATDDDVSYLLEAANHFLPAARLTADDVVSAWAGIRPLLPSDGGPGSATREHAIECRPGFVSITGGKLTTYRVMASQVVDAACAELGVSPGRARTDTEPLPGGRIGTIESAVRDAMKSVGEESLARRLVLAHGDRWRDVWRTIDESDAWRARVVASLDYRMGELRFAVEREMACTLGDLLIRRTHLAFEASDHGCGAALAVARALSGLLGWDDARVEAECRAYAEEIARVFGGEAR